MKRLLLSMMLFSAVSAFSVPDFETMVKKKNDVQMAEAGPFALRGYGTLSVKSASWSLPSGGRGSVAVFTAENPEKAKITASKYVMDFQNYGPVEKIRKNGRTLCSVRHGGFWFFGLDGNSFYVCSAPDLPALNGVVASLKLEQLSPVPEQAYPKYLDNFDNASLAIWWAPNKKNPAEMKWMKENPVVANLHYQTLDFQPAPGVLDTKGPENAVAQLKKLEKPYRTMMWTGTGKNAWFSWMNLPGDVFETVPDGFSYRNYFEANGYYGNQAASKLVRSLEMDAIVRLMNRWKDDPDLLAWMEPHGEFQLFAPPTIPANAKTRFPEYLKTHKKYTLRSLENAWGLKNGEFRSWNDVSLPDEAWFKGRREHFLDLDTVPWKWSAVSMEEGMRKKVMNPAFEDQDWFSCLRTDKRLLIYSTDKTPLWCRFTFDLPASFSSSKKAVYLHLLPYTIRRTTLSVWVNGINVALNAKDPDCYENRHLEMEISKALKPGKNQFTIYSSGGRMAYSAFLNDKKAEKYPFRDKGVNQRFVDWRDYLNQTKFDTLEQTLRVMRSVDSVRPIKVMTPNQWLSDAQDLFERYGAYPQLTGECSWYRPMHYKGYTLLRNRLSSSEPGGPVFHRKNAQVMYSMAFFESQDCHDYGFDFSRDFWKYQDVVQWWTENKALLKTFGKTNLIYRDLGLLRDTLQDKRYDNSMIWNWDLSRGPLPSLGLTPVLVDGKDLEKGLANSTVKVLFDCATIVMTDAQVAAIRKFVSDGGVFIAQHHTGRHSENIRDSWILAKAFGMSAADRPSMGKIRFTEKQTLFPSLRGKTMEGGGAAVTYAGEKITGAVGILGKAEPVALYEDGTMAVAQVGYGKGRFIFLGTPFYYSCKDDQGKWVNEERRQMLLAELLDHVGIRRETFSSDSRVWFDKRRSKNGLYDVYFGGALGFRGTWSLTDRSNGTLSVLRRAPGNVVDVTSSGMPDVPSVWKNGILSFGKQPFSPYQIRQYAVVREDAGRTAPISWLEEQQKGWYALPSVSSDLLLRESQKTVADFQKKMGEDGLDLSSGWEASIDRNTQWIPASMGSWDVAGWTVRECVRYRKTVKIPDSWRNGKSRILLGFFTYKGHGTTGIHKNATVRIDGKTVLNSVSYEFCIPLAEHILEKDSFVLEMDVFGKTGPDKSCGPWGSMYLYRRPAPTDVLSLTGEWEKATEPLKNEGSVKLPFRGKAYGLERVVTIPSSWKNKVIRLRIQSSRQDSDINSCILNGIGFLEERTFGTGVRVDRYLKAGEKNRILLLNNRKPESRIIDVKNIFLEAYPLD